MSIESFTHKYPADDRFAEEISADQNIFYTSPVNFMTDIYIQEGAQGLWDATERYHKARKNKEIIIEKFALDEIYLNHHAVLLGVTIKTVRDILNNGTFDEYLFNGRIESAFTETGDFPDLILNPKVEEIPEDRLDEMKEVVGNDGTYADFLEAGFKTLPRKLRLYLKRDGFDEYMPRLLPDYITRTSLLISSQTKRTL